MTDKKVKIAIILNGSSLGGTERSAIATLKYLGTEKFSPLLIMLQAPNADFNKRLENIKPVVVNKNDLPDYTKKNKIDVIYSFVHLDKETKEKLKSITKVVQSIVFTEQYDKNNDSNLIISKTEYLKVKLYNNNKIENSRVLYFPIDVNKWENISNKVDTYCKDKRIILGRIGRAEPSKWEYLILSTLHYFKKKDGFKNYRFIFAGMPKLYQAYVKLFFRSALKDNSIILLPELVTDDDVGRFYKSLDVFLQTSWIGESFGCVITEAFCFDVPVITDWKHFVRKNEKVDLMKYDTQLEVVDSDKNGFYSNYPFTTYNYLQSQTKQSLKKMGKNGHNKTKKLYEAERVVKNFENIILGEILKKDSDLSKKIYPTKKETEEFVKEYKRKFDNISKNVKNIPYGYRLGYAIKSKIWRMIEYIYLAIRKLLKRAFNYNIEKNR